MRGVLFILLGVAAAGCGGPRTVPVSGRVTLNDRPLPNAGVTFEPTQGDVSMTAVGTTDEQGRFELTTVGGAPGAVVGQHRVSISTAISSSGDERTQLPREVVPLEYQDGSVTFEVASQGNNDADFAIRTLRRRP